MSSPTTEQKIAKYFDKESNNFAQRHREDGIPLTAQKQVDAVCTHQVDHVVDVGSGPGSVLIEMIEQGVNRGTGIDLSPEMNTIAQQRLVEKGLQDQVEIIEGNYLEIDLIQPDAVSLHRVLCCHPDRKGMLQHTANLDAKVITLTVPRDWKIFRVLIFFVSFFANLRDNFTPYIHQQSEIDEQLQNLGYQLEDRYKGWFWVTSTYTKISENS